jgi:hypothetical protein
MATGLRALPLHTQGVLQSNKQLCSQKCSLLKLAAAPLQAYPAAKESEQAATMAANELAAHAAMQPPAVAAECDQLAKLLGSFSPRAGPEAGEQVRFLDVTWQIAQNAPARPQTKGRSEAICSCDVHSLAFTVWHQCAPALQWLVFRNDGLTTAAAYAAAAAEAGVRRQALGSGELLDRLSPARPLARRRLFVLRLLRQVCW